MNTLAQQLQALLFTAGEAVSYRDLCELTHASDEQLAAAIDELRSSLSTTGLALITTATHTQLVTSPDVAEFLAQFSTTDENELSKAALETLSLIAYRGPITRIDIDVLRGVDSRRMVRQLLLRGLIRQLKIAGQASQYEITEEFLAHIGMTNKEELPNFSELSSHEGLTRLLDRT
ncbi:MAG: SMC-Scp complex subunit ScpB [Candidatus Andersenbacteria bacterium RIFCSPHIGHO2_01_FULL_46_36]|uniref:SMC-Scp complex subunit ScpB n=1 Tax=Candidatus Andersenbacteria bacterium RIFCSPHIGHO2_12_FULL_45_11 TaxID=1797281 RepID=A0A1G1X4A9_9BACT|nr:MAG: SMC-Scp complex subunit ScpB [Candidatus Andersenbacteria bacterium RIFCSPHIGHO2_01_FULL_46_36]OGY34167.1 MAG: SMC-Scp complex subunit ScpB [Candidatus Andersenbacteria bacterium RIFCSPHIGHO2_12_FULL_45_11]QBM02286.1 segregation and condensation protein B [uncultured archaeon]